MIVVWRLESFDPSSSMDTRTHTNAHCDKHLVCVRKSFRSRLGGACLIVSLSVRLSVCLSFHLSMDYCAIPLALLYFIVVMFCDSLCHLCWFSMYVYVQQICLLFCPRACVNAFSPFNCPFNSCSLSAVLVVVAALYHHCCFMLQLILMLLLVVLLLIVHIYNSFGNRTCVLLYVQVCVCWVCMSATKSCQCI